MQVVTENQPVETVIEKAYFHIENGGLTLSIVSMQHENGYHEYRFKHEMALHGQAVESTFPLGSSEIVSWMNMALQRVSLRVAAEGDRVYQVFEPPQVQAQNGVLVEKVAVSFLRIAMAFQREAKEFGTYKQYYQYMSDHPDADPTRHSVKDKDDKSKKEDSTVEERAEEHGETVEEENTEERAEHEYVSWGGLFKENFQAKVTDRIKALWSGGAKVTNSGLVVKKFLKEAPEVVKKFIEDAPTRRAILMGLHDHFSKLPKATFDAVKKSFKNELHQFKEAASGVKTWLGGKPMSRAQKNAVFTVCWDTTVLALGLALPMIMAGHAGTTVAGAATKRFAQDLAKKIAVNALKEELNDYTIPGSVQEFGYGMHHLVDFGKGLTAAGKKPKADDGDLMTAFTMGLINRTMSKMTPEKFASMIEDIATGEDLDKPEPTKDNKKTANAWMITSKGVVETV